MIVVQLTPKLYFVRSIVLIVVQAEERNMYDQHWLFSVLKERYPFDLYYTHFLV